MKKICLSIQDTPLSNQLCEEMRHLSVHTISLNPLFDFTQKKDTRFPCDILVLDVVRENMNLIYEYIRPKNVVLFTNQTFHEVFPSIEKYKIQNICFQKSDPTDNFLYLVNNLKKILSNDIFGIKKYLTKEQRKEYDEKALQWELQHSNEYSKIIQQILNLTNPYIENVKYLRSMNMVLEELLSNAFYNAPTSPEGQNLFQHNDRTQEIRLSPKNRIKVTWTGQKDCVFFSIKDTYGSLAYHQILHSLGMYHERSLQPKEGSGGAGLGLAIVYRHISDWVINIKKGQVTEIIVKFDIKNSYSTFLKQPRSLNIFIQE